MGVNKLTSAFVKAVTLRAVAVYLGRLAKVCRLLHFESIFKYIHISKQLRICLRPQVNLLISASSCVDFCRN